MVNVYNLESMLEFLLSDVQLLYINIICQKSHVLKYFTFNKKIF